MRVDRVDKMNAMVKSGAERERGFSAIEIVIVVVVVGIVSTLSVVMFGTAKARYDLRRKAQSVSSQIDRARSIAIKYNRTLTLGFRSENTVFGLTCASCSETELAELESQLGLYPFKLASDVTLSTHPSMTIRGNGTIQSANGTIVITDGQGRQISVNISNSGRTNIGDVVEASTVH